MLVLSRKESQRLVIGDNIVVQIVRVQGGTVRLGIVAPPEVSIRREELAARMALPTDAAPTAFAAR
jgi:carbon storage regulator